MVHSCPYESGPQEKNLGLRWSWGVITIRTGPISPLGTSVSTLPTCEDEMKCGSILIIKTLDSLTMTFIVIVINSVYYIASGLEVKSQDSGARLLRFKSRLCYFLTVWPWTSYIITFVLSLSFLICTCLFVLLWGLSKLLHVKLLKWYLACS